jgi:hypothetical protein
MIQGANIFGLSSKKYIECWVRPPGQIAGSPIYLDVPKGQSDSILNLKYQQPIRIYGRAFETRAFRYGPPMLIILTHKVEPR